MAEPKLNAFELGAKLAWALDTKDWEIVEGCFKQIQQHKKELQAYKSKKSKANV